MQIDNYTPGRRFLLCAIVLPISLGCGHGGRMSVEGTVTLDGRPLEKGSIQFSPLPGTKGPTAGGDIVNGKFNILPVGGPFAGKFTVQINAVGLTGRKILDPRSNTMVDEYAQCLPARYNSQSELQAEVTANGPNRFDFALTSVPH
jgi:hypothetical protein